MTFRDHGNWTAYAPTAIPDNAPPSSLFAKRDSDGQDWYDYVHPGTNFTPNNVVICAYWSDRYRCYIVGAATRDPTAIFPARGLVHEQLDYAGSNPQGDLGDKAYDPATGVFSDLPPPSEKSAKAGIEARIAVLEAKLGLS